jgi:hypothetical protein
MLKLRFPKIARFCLFLAISVFTFCSPTPAAAISRVNVSTGQMVYVGGQRFVKNPFESRAV